MKQYYSGLIVDEEAEVLGMLGNLRSGGAGIWTWPPGSRAMLLLTYQTATSTLFFPCWYQIWLL